MKLTYRPLTAIALVAGMTLLSSVPAPAAAPTARPAATTAPAPRGVAVLNVVVLFDKLLEKAAADTELANQKKKATDELSDRQAEIENLKKKLESFNEGTKEYKERQNDLLQKVLALKNQRDFAEAQYQTETFIRTKGLYKKINESVAEYAKEKGIGLVLIADNAEMDKVQTPEVLQALVSTRKVLFYDGSYDITTAVLTKMNTEYAKSH